MWQRAPLSLWFVTGFSAAGLLFSGYVSIVTFFSQTCAVSEGCPRFLGLPACYFGVIMYAVLVILSVAALSGRVAFHKALAWVAGISLLGVLFAGYFSVIEFAAFIEKGFSAALGVPTCLVGLMLYMIIFATSALGLAHYRHAHK